MFLKFLVIVTLTGTGFWNRSVGPCCGIAEESAVRLPNVIFGSLSPLAIAINRVAKETLCRRHFLIGTAVLRR